MTTAIWKVHKEKGFFNTEGGYEFNLLLIAALLVLVDEGPGALAVGSSEGFGSRIAFASVAAGVAGGFAAMELGRREHAKLQGGGEDAPGQDNGAAGAQPAGASASA